MSKMSLIFANNPNKKGFFGKKMCEKILSFFQTKFWKQSTQQTFCKTMNPPQQYRN